MQTIKTAASEFLSQRRIAVTGVSSHPNGHGSNVVYQRLRSRGYDVVAVNPNLHDIDDQPVYPNLTSIPGGVDAVVIGTRPERAHQTVRECIDLGIKHVWMHQGPGPGSVSEIAAQYGRDHGITVIDGGCPCMFDPAADPGHKLLRFWLTRTGKVPREV